jgi:hypothetical protein
MPKFYALMKYSHPDPISNRVLKRLKPQKSNYFLARQAFAGLHPITNLECK